MASSAAARTDRLSKAIQLAFIAGIVLLWYAVTVTQWISPLFLPNPVEVFRMFVRIIVDRRGLARRQGDVHGGCDRVPARGRSPERLWDTS